MAGIVGMVSLNGEKFGAREEVRETVESMAEMLRHRSSYQRDVSAVDARVCGGAVRYFPSDWETRYCHASEDVVVWIDGEIHNADTWSPARPSTAIDGPADALAARYRSEADWTWLTELDGIYAGVLYDARRRRLHLFGDRHGFQPLFWGRVGETLVWSSEVKAFLAHPDFEPSIRESSIDHFFEHGYLLGSETWFEGVELLDAGTAISWDLDTESHESRSYWDWSDIDPLERSISFDEAAAELGCRIREAVDVRCRGDHRLGVMLSGGLDSRAILASVPDGASAGGAERPLAATFGRTDSRELEIARRVAERDGAEHLVRELREDNWFDHRTQGVWVTDGHLPLRHMHSLPLHRMLSEHCDVNLNGFLGGNIPGGDYLDGDAHPPVETIEHRGRRFISEGVRAAETFLKQRRPLVANDVVDWTYALPPEWIEGAELYEAALLHEFPEYFRDIPYEDTGVPISAGPWRRRLHDAREDIEHALSRWLGSHDETDGEAYADYPNWLVGPSNRDHVEALLFGEDRLYPDYISDIPVRETWNRLDNGELHADWNALYNLLTFETWLRQVFRDELRPDAT